MELLTLAKAELKRSENEHDHPFRYFYLGTFGQYPEVRTVVKRDLDDRLAVTFFTDSRTRKVSQIQDDNRVSALFYHPGHRLQIRMTGSAMKLKEDSLAYAAYYQQVNDSMGKKDYSTLAIPGTPQKDEAEIIYGETIHLTVFRILPADIDVVLLGKDHHRRSHYKRDGSLWIETKLVP